MKKIKKRTILYITAAILICLCLIFSSLYAYNIAINLLQTQINTLAAKAKKGKYEEFTKMDKILLWIGFRSLVVGGYLLGLDGAATVLNHYLTSNGKDLAVDPVYFRNSPVVKKILIEHYRRLQTQYKYVKITKIKIYPAQYGRQDSNLYYMMNPFVLTIKDSIAGDTVFSNYTVTSHIEFYKGSVTYFYLPGRIIIFPGSLGAALEPLGMGKPFDLISTWQDVQVYR